MRQWLCSRAALLNSSAPRFTLRIVLKLWYRIRTGSDWLLLQFWVNLVGFMPVEFGASHTLQRAACTHHWSFFIHIHRGLELKTSSVSSWLPTCSDCVTLNCENRPSSRCSCGSGCGDFRAVGLQWFFFSHVFHYAAVLRQHVIYFRPHWQSYHSVEPTWMIPVVNSHKRSNLGWQDYQILWELTIVCVHVFSCMRWSPEAVHRWGH